MSSDSNEDDYEDDFCQTSTTIQEKFQDERKQEEANMKIASPEQRPQQVINFNSAVIVSSDNAS